MPNIEQIKPGQMPRAVEWNALADRYNGGSVGLAGYDGRSLGISSGLVRVKNVSGSDRDRFDCMSLGDTVIELETNAQQDLWFEADTADPDETPVILQEPIADGLVGVGRIFGVTLAKIATASATSLRSATPNASNHNLDAGVSGPIGILSSPSASAASLRPVLLGATPGPLLYRFTLNESWSSNAADADIFEMDGTDTTIDADVLDPLSIFGSLDNGDAGLCVLQNGSYYVIQAPC